jgi:hypothetical protein
MVIKTSEFEFLRIEHLTQVGDFSPSVDSGEPVDLDHYNVFKSYFCVLNPISIVEFNILSKSGIEIGQSYAEIQLHSHRKTSEIATSRKNRKI